jgi:(hydroxyamino)benzene mutase
MQALQRRAARLGVLLLILGFATGGLLAMAMTGKTDADVHAISASHLNALFGCFWLCALAFTLPLLRFGAVGTRRLVDVTIVAAYGNWLVTLVKAFLHVAGVGWTADGTNDAVFVALNVLVVVPSFVGSGAWLYGLGGSGPAPREG